MLPTENRASINVEVSSNADKAFRELLSGLTDLDRQAKTLSASFATQAAANQAANDRAKELHKLAVDVGTGMREVATTVGIAAVAIGTTFVLAVKSVSDYGSKINDLALKAGSSTTKIQELTYAAVQNGVSIDTAVAAVARLSKALVEDPKSADKALRTLGLSLDELRRLDPVEQFVAIGDAIGKIPNPSQQAALSMELLGKGGAEMLKLFRSGLSETMQKAEELGLVLSEKDIRAIDDMGDSFSALKMAGEVALSKALLPMVPALTAIVTWSIEVVGGFSKMTTQTADWSKTVNGAVSGVLRSFASLLVGIDYLQTGFRGLQTVSDNVFGALGVQALLAMKTALGWAELQKFINPGAYAVMRSSGQLTEARESATWLEGALNGLAEHQREASQASADLGNRLQGLAAIARKAADEQSWLSKGTEAATDQTKKQVAAIKDLGDAAKKTKALLSGLSGSSPVLDASVMRVLAFASKPIGAYGLPVSGNGFTGSSSVLDPDVIQALAFQTWASGHGNLPSASFGGNWTGSLKTLSASMADLSRVVGSGEFASSVQTIANIVGAMSLGSDIGKVATSGTGGKITASSAIAAGLQGIVAMQQATSSDSTLMNVLGGAGTGAAIGTSIAPGIGTAIGAVAGGIYGAIASLFKPSAQEQADAKANEQIGNAKAQLLQAYGSLDAIATLSKQLGVDLAGAWGDQGQAGLSHFNYLIGEFNKGLERNQKLIADLAAMQPGQLMAQSVAQVIQGGHLTEDSRKAIGSYITGQTANLAGYVTSYLASGASLQGGVGTGMVGAATGAIGQMLQNGQSWSDVAKTFGASIYALQAGTGQSNPLLDMVNWAGKDTVAPILDAATGIGNIASTMQNLSLLDQKTFSNLTTGLSDSYKKLTEQGVEGNSALRLMQPSLQKIWEISDRTKMTVDQATQDLMDQALANGIIGDQYKSSNDQLKDAIDRLIGSIDSLAGVFSGTGDVSGDGGVDSGYAGGGAGSGGPWDDWNYRGGQPVPSFADGTDGYRYFGGGTLALLHDWEAVTPLRKAGASGSGGRPLHVHVMVGRREIAQAVFEELPYVMQGHGVLQ